MKFRNKTDNDLIIGGSFVKAGEILETTHLIENPNFEMVDDVKPPVPTVSVGVAPVQTPADPGQPPVSAAPEVPPTQTNPGVTS